jgi:hypothetical protein
MGVTKIHGIHREAGSVSIHVDTNGERNNMYHELVEATDTYSSEVMTQYVINLIECPNIQVLLTRLYANGAVYGICVGTLKLKVVLDASHKNYPKAMRLLSPSQPKPVRVFVLDHRKTPALVFPKGFEIKTVYIAKDGKWIVEGIEKSRCTVM